LGEGLGDELVSFLWGLGGLWLTGVNAGVIVHLSVGIENVTTQETSMGKLIEQRMNAGATAKQIAENAQHYGPHVLSHARQMVADGNGHFKFVKKYGSDGGDYANATLWVVDDTTITMRHGNVVVKG